ncbi:MAG: hypothetical protein ACI9MR_002612, partial [Myxococcota bacterium]
MGYVLEEKQSNAGNLAHSMEMESETQDASRSRSGGAPVQQKALNDPAKDDKAAANKKKEAEEKERTAAVQAKWEGLLGKWLGGELAPLVLEHVSADALNGYVQDGLKQAGPALGDVLKKETKPDAAQAKALKAYSDALAGAMTGLVDKWVQSAGGQKVLASISRRVQDNPGWVMGIIGGAVVGGAIAAWFANADLPEISVPLNLGKDWKLKAGIDLSGIQNLGFQGASLVVSNKNKALTLGAKVNKKEEKNEDGSIKSTTHTGKLDLKAGKKDSDQLTFVMNGKITETAADGMVAYTTDGKLNFVDAETGMTIAVGADGKWDSKGNKENKVSFTMASGKDSKVNGKLTIDGKKVTIVDADGNIVETSSAGFSVAVGKSGQKFEAGAQVEKSASGATKGSASIKGEGQLGAGTIFKGGANVGIEEDKVTVKLNAGMTAKIGGQTVEFAGAYEKDGPITGKIKVEGKDGEYKEITGTKNGDVVTFSTKDVFAGGHSVERKSTKNADGTVANTTTAGVALGKGHKASITGGDKTNVSYEGTDIGGTGINAKANAGSDGYGVGLSFDDGMLKANLDFMMTEGTSSMGLSAGMKTESGFKFDGNLKLEESRLKEVGVKLGYQNPDEFKGFLLGYKQTWLGDNKGTEHHFDALLEYSMGRWLGRLEGGLDISGGQVKK